MCLAIPGKVESIVDADVTKAVVNFDGIKRHVDISLIDACAVGDYVLVHVGFAIQKVDAQTARDTYKLLSEIDKNQVDEELKHE